MVTFCMGWRGVADCSASTIFGFGERVVFGTFRDD